MLRTLNDLLDRLLPPSAAADAAATEHQLRLATAVTVATEWMRRHVSNENELVIPVYAAHPPEGGWERGAAGV